MWNPLRTFTNARRNGLVVVECRRCGTKLDTEADSCPRCGSHRIARYEIQ